MSKIIGELLKATGATKQGRKEDDQDFFERVMVATSKLSDDEFDDLSEDTQDWCNEASIYINKRKDVPEPSDWSGGGDDEEEEEKPKRGGRRGRGRAAKDDSDEKPTRGRGRRGRGRAKDEDEEEEKPKRGRRGRRSKAKEEDEEEEKPARGRGRGRRSRKAKEPEGPVVGEEIAFADITEGMVLSNVDGELEGEVIKKVSRSFTLATDDGEEKITKTQAKGSILEEMPEGGGEQEPEKEEEEEKPKRGRGRSRREKSDTGSSSGRSGRRGRGKAKDDGDDSAVAAIRKVMIDDPDMTIDEVGEALEDDGVEFKAATLKLTYNTFVEHYELFEKAGLLGD